MSLDILFYLSILTIAVLNGLVGYKKLTSPFRALVLIMLYILFSESAVRVLILLNKNSLPLYHILCIIQYIAFAFIFSLLLNSKNVKQYIRLSIIPFIALCLLNIVLFDAFFKLIPLKIIMLSYIIFAFFSLMLFMQMLNEPKETNIYKQSTFWFNCAVLVFSIISPLCFGVDFYFSNHHIKTDVLGNIILYLNCLYYATLGYAINLDKKQSSAQVV
jgi:hypothetical protein